MAEKSKLEVKIISSETIKPSSPTPTNRKTVALSLLEQTYPPFYSEMLFVYNHSRTKQQPFDIDINHLKLCLSKTLSIFSPFAGRCDNASTLLCTDQGITFIIANVDCVLSDGFISSSETELVKTLLPPANSAGLGRPISELVPLSFQVNIFNCGGVVIGCNNLHKLMDATSFATFLSYWAGLSNNCDKNILVEPNFDAAASAFPPSPKAELYNSTSIEKILRAAANPVTVNVVARKFVFPNKVINELKVKATSDQLPNPTRFEALTGFIWEHAYKAALAAGSVLLDSLTTELSSTADIRARINPPLPKGSIGNLAFIFTVRADGQANISNLSREIHEAISQAKDLGEKFKGEKGTDTLIEKGLARIDDIIKGKPGSYSITSWCNLGFNKLDFGFGMPGRLIPFNGEVRPHNRNSIIFTDYANDNHNGIEVWLFLEEKEMLILESNPHFLAFASPS